MHKAYLAAAILAFVLAGCYSGPPPMMPAPAPGAQIVGSSGDWLDVQGGAAADRTPLILFHCHGSPNQSWVVGGNQIAGNGASCLDVQGGAPTDGSPVVLFHCDGGPSQRWALSNGGIVGIGGKCIDVLDGATGGRPPGVLKPRAG